MKYGRLVPKDVFFKPVEHVGAWWLGNDQDQRIHGRMKFVWGGEAELLLFDEAGHYFEFEGAEKTLLCGVCEENTFISLIGAGGGKFSNWRRETGANVASQKIGFIEAWVGDIFFANMDDVAFDKISLRFNNLDQWLGTSCMSNYGVRGKSPTTAVSFAVPSPLQVFSNEDVDATVEWTATVVSNEDAKFVATSALLECAPEIVIKSRQGKMKFYGEGNTFQHWIKVFCGWFGLLIGKKAIPMDCWGFIRDDQQRTEIPLHRLNKRKLEKPYLETVPRDEIRFPFKCIGNHFRDCCEKFCGFPSVVHGFAGQMAFMQCETTVFSPTLLAEQVFLFEGLVRALYFGASRERKLKLANTADPIFKGLTNVFPILGDEQIKKSLKQYLITMRSNYAHGLDSGNSDEFSLYYCAVTWMWTFLSAMILSKAGMPTDIMQHCLEASYADYKRPNAMLPDLLKKLEHRRHPVAASRKTSGERL